MPHQPGNLVCFGIQSEVSGVKHVYLRTGNILEISGRLAQVKRQVVLPPENKKARLRLLHPRLPFGVSQDIRAVVIKEITLYLRLPGRVQKCKLVSPKIGVVEIDLRIVADMARPGRRQRQQVAPQSAFVSTPVCPERTSRRPVRTEPLVVRDRILHNQGSYALGVSHCHAETNRAAIILHVERVVR